MPQETDDELPIVTRWADESDRALIIDSWRRSAFKGPWAGMMPASLFKREQTRLANRLFDRYRPLIACWDEDHDQIYGWICGSADRPGETVVHYCYTKHAFRRAGIARRLLADLGHEPRDLILATHITYVYTNKLIPEDLLVVNDPFLAHRMAYA